MNKPNIISNRGALQRRHKSKFSGWLVPAILCLLNLQSIHAGSATWKLDPVSGDWNTAANWTPVTVPNKGDVATFDFSDTVEISLAKIVAIDGMIFNPGAPPFTITCHGNAPLFLWRQGIKNQSGMTQTVHVTDAGNSYAGLLFNGGATAGSKTLFTTELSEGGPGIDIHFVERSTAGESTFILNGALRPATSAEARCYFFNSSSAGNATFIVQGGGIDLGNGGLLFFENTSTAGMATITSNGSEVSGGLGGQVTFSTNTTADSATLIANGGLNGGLGGRLSFKIDSTGGNARVRLTDTGTLDIGDHNGPGMSIGSIEGDGIITLGSNELTVGSNGRDTVFSGTVRDGQARGPGGSLVKVGSGRLTLMHKNFYSGGTTILDGALIVTNGAGSATGRGPVNVNAGTLGGRGIIGGAVVLGSGAGGSGGVIAPSAWTDADPGTITINSDLTFNSDGQYQCGLNSTTATADKIVASGLTVDSEAQFILSDSGTATLPIGTAFTVVDNTASTSIAGTFGNLPDGSTVAIGSNQFQASYSGGDGNDLVLTVVP